MIPSKEKEKYLMLAYNIAAQIVSIYGEEYLPIFERIHQELEKFKHKNTMLQYALAVSNDVKVPGRQL